MSHDPLNLTLGTRNYRESVLFVVPRQNLYSILSHPRKWCCTWNVKENSSNFSASKVLSAYLSTSRSAMAVPTPFVTVGGNSSNPLATVVRLREATTSAPYRADLLCFVEICNGYLSVSKLPVAAAPPQIARSRHHQWTVVFPLLLVPTSETTT